MRNFLLMILVVAAVTAGTATFARGSDEGKKANENWFIERGDTEVPQVNVSQVKGKIVIAGSSTVYPVAEKLADLFREDGYSDRITVESIGSGAGFERWTKGETDISNASRPIKNTEVETAKSIGRDPIEFLIGIDALAVVINPENDWVTDVDLPTLAKIFSSDKWSDVNPDWPDHAIEKFSPGTDSGTFDFFVEKIFKKKAETLISAPSLQLSEDDNILSRGVQNSKYGIGYFGYAYYAEAGNALKALSINTVLPSEESIYSNSYALARPLFMYSAAKIMKEKAQIAAFLAYTLNNVEAIIKETGYFPAPEPTLAESRAKWVETMEGTY